MKETFNASARPIPRDRVTTSRIDAPFDLLHKFLREHYLARWWRIEERDESIGVYVSGSKQLVNEVCHAYARGWWDREWNQSVDRPSYEFRMVGTKEEAQVILNALEFYDKNAVHNMEVNEEIVQPLIRYFDGRLSKKGKGKK